jgi:hypothetical protein
MCEDQVACVRAQAGTPAVHHGGGTGTRVK